MHPRWSELVQIRARTAFEVWLQHWSGSPSLKYHLSQLMQKMEEEIRKYSSSFLFQMSLSAGLLSPRLKKQTIRWSYSVYFPLKSILIKYFSKKVIVYHLVI